MAGILCVESLAGSFEQCVKVGSEHRIERELRYLKEQEGEVYYLSKDVKRFNLGQGIHHIALNKTIPAFLRNFVYLFYPLFNLNIFRKCDFYYVHNISGCLPAVIAKLILGNKRIVSKYDWNWTFTFRRKYSYPVFVITKILERVCLKNSDLIIAATERLKDDAYRAASDPSKKIIVVSNWFDDLLFKPSQKKTLNKASVSLISVGRLDNGKNHILLLESVKKMSETAVVNVLIIGSGEEKDNLLNYSNRNNIRLKIIDSVPNPEIPKFLRCADIFLITSKYEGQPQAVIEALSCGLPVIGTKVRGIKDVVRHSHNGLLCSENPMEIAKAIGLLINDDELYARLRSNSAKSVQNFSFEKVMGEIYRNIKNVS
jgi:glycosyltransferase involved in cell wall biosynthesis